MKKRVAILLAGALALSLCGCQSKEAPVSDTSTQVETETTSTEEAGPATGVNLIPAGDFSAESGAWGTYEESGGSGAKAITGNQEMRVKISSAGSKAHSVQLYCGGFELLNGGKYTFSFDARSSVDRTIDWRIQINGGDYHQYAGEEGLALTSEMQHFSFEFTMAEASDPSPRLCFNLGDRDKEQGLEAHEIFFDNVSLVLDDASNAKEVDTSTNEVDINVNQIGYRPSDSKRAIFRDATKDTEFTIVDAKTKKEVYRGKISGQSSGGSSEDTVAYGDFSDFTTPGTYRIVAQNSGQSYSFTIADSVYSDAFDASIRMLYLQRCGMELSKDYANDFAHAACHTEMATIYKTDTQIDVSGGWHDAGDYGRYVVPGAKTVADLLLAYEKNPSLFTDSVGIAESGNGVADVLDEARYELEWFFKVQDTDGGVYHKVTGLNFDGICMPEDCTESLYVLPKSKTATGDFAAVMFMAARVYKTVDPAFAQKCLDAANLAMPYLESHQEDKNYTNPSNCQTGEYPDTSGRDELLWAYAEGYKTTQRQEFADKLINFDYRTYAADGLGWAQMTDYAFYALLTADKEIANLPIDVKDLFLKTANRVKSIALEDAYGSSIRTEYPWGSNMSIANNGMLLLMASEVTGDSSYQEAARLQLDYLFGCNTTSYCFLTGYGEYHPENPHHRPSQTLGKCMPGMLVGGPDSGLDDPLAKSVLAEKPKAACYIDNDQSYSCNEITIYWNSPLIYLMSAFQ